MYARYNAQIANSQRLGLVRKLFDFAEPTFLAAVLKEQGLESYWWTRDPDTSKPVNGTAVSAAR